jgi:hypothetical protein
MRVLVAVVAAQSHLRTTGKYDTFQHHVEINQQTHEPSSSSSSAYHNEDPSMHKQTNKQKNKKHSVIRNLQQRKTTPPPASAANARNASPPTVNRFIFVDLGRCNCTAHKRRETIFRIDVLGAFFCCSTTYDDRRQRRLIARRRAVAPLSISSTNAFGRITANNVEPRSKFDLCASWRRCKHTRTD